MTEHQQPPVGGRTGTPVEERTNPVHAFAGAALREVGRVAGAPGWAMSGAEQAEALVELDELVGRVVELKTRVLAAADLNAIGDGAGHSSTASWLAAATRQTRARCHGEVSLARLLDRPAYAATREALATGAVNVDQARVILRCLEDLATGADAGGAGTATGAADADGVLDEVTPEQVQAAQDHLIDLAGVHDAKALRVLAAKIFEVIAPGSAEQREAEALERAERRARAKTRFSMRDNGNGSHSGGFTIPTIQAAILSKAVQAFAAPRRTSPDAWVDAHGNKVSYPTRLGHAFCDLIDHLPGEALPTAGGLSARVVVTTSLDTLRDGLGSAVLDTGEPISPAQARRMACAADLIPAVLGTDSHPLDLGRANRLFTPAQRVALNLRDQGCTAEHCDRPPAWTEAHHDTPWSQGGPTDLGNARLLCAFHHQRIHDSAYATIRLPAGKVRFTRRQ